LSGQDNTTTYFDSATHPSFVLFHTRSEAKLFNKLIEETKEAVDRYREFKKQGKANDN